MVKYDMVRCIDGNLYDERRRGCPPMIRGEIENPDIKIECPYFKPKKTQEERVGS